MQDLWPRWQHAARVLGGRMTVSREATAAPRLVVQIDGIEVSGGVTATGIGWLAAAVAAAGDWRCAVSPSRGFPLAGAFAVTVGDRAFDARRRVRTSDAPLARAWLDARVRALLLAADYHFVIDHGQVRALTMDRHGSPEQLVIAARATAALAGRGLELGRRWRDLAARLGVMVRDGDQPASSLRVPHAGAIVEVDAFAGGLARRWVGCGLFVRLRCPRTGGAADRFALRDRQRGRAFLPGASAVGQRCGVDDAVDADYTSCADDPARLRARFAGATALLAGARPELIVGDVQAVTLFLLGVDVAAARVRAGVELAGRLALDDTTAGLADPYR